MYNTHEMNTDNCHSMTNMMNVDMMTEMMNVHNGNHGNHHHVHNGEPGFSDVNSFVSKALEKDGNLIRFITNPPVSLQLISCHNTVTALRYIDNPDKSVVKLVISKYESGIKSLADTKNKASNQVLDMLYDDIPYLEISDTESRTQNSAPDI